MGAGSARQETLCATRSQQRAQGEQSCDGFRIGSTRRCQGSSPAPHPARYPHPRCREGQLPPAGVLPAPARFTVLGAAGAERRKRGGGGGRFLGSHTGTQQSPVGPRWPNTTKSCPYTCKDHPSWGRNSTRQGILKQINTRGELKAR